MVVVVAETAAWSRGVPVAWQLTMPEPAPPPDSPDAGPGGIAAADYIRARVRDDVAAGKYGGRVQTRFPPEPNGYLHIGHAKAIALNFGIAAEHGGVTRLRMDDTNPETEGSDYVAAIEQDVTWLGFEPEGTTVFASDYFDQLYRWAEQLIEAGLAYVDDQDAETISAQRGAFGEPGQESPYRDRPAAENLDLFRRMRDGEFAEGERVLRAKIDMGSPNMLLRDPVLYRIRNTAHHRTGDRWHIYPTYDWAHGQSDAIEGVTHSLCSREFKVHRPLYDWLLEHLDLPGERPQQLEFPRLSLTHTVMSKRRLLPLVEQGVVDGWDDPRLPTLRGLRRRGYPPEAIVEFVEHLGVGTADGIVEIELLESFVRTHLNRVAPRRMAVLEPLKLVLTDWPEGHVEWVDAQENPEDPGAGHRKVPFTGQLWIEQDDFREDPPPKYYRLTVGREVRLRSAYLVTATAVIKDASGRVVEVHATYDPDPEASRKVKSTMHWVSAEHAVPAQVVLYERLFTDPTPEAHDGVDPLSFLDADSRIVRDAMVEPALAEVGPGEVVQFERLGYFARDPGPDLLFHRTVGLRDEWARIQKRAGAPGDGQR